MTFISDPKLKEARAEIEAVLKRFDIGGFCVLHNAPDRSEVFIHLSPSYSNLHGKAPVVQLRSSLEEDYKGDTDARDRDLMATANMVRSLAMGAGNASLYLMELSKFVDEKTGAVHEEKTEYEPDQQKGEGS